MNDGKVYTLVLNAYPSARKLVGTCMKLDFQQTVLKRMTAAPLNTERFLMYLADENQFFFTTSGSAGDGDEDFMSIGRQARIFNLLVTQAVSSYLAVQKDENKINAMMQNAANRIFFMNLDDKTNRLAEATAGQIMTEKLSSSGPDLKLSNVMGDAKSGSVSRSQEKVNQYDHQYFVKLRPFEAVIFNTTRASGPKSTQANLKATASFLPKEAVTAAVNDYYQAFLENRAHELGIAYVYDSQPPTPNEEYEQLLRGQGILRSWFNGVAIAVPSSQAEKAEVMPSVAGPTLTTEAVIAELGNWPALEDLQAYNQAIPLQSDLEASLASDPLISREDTHIAAPTNKDEPDQSKGCENQLGKNLRQTGKRPNRILAHLTGLDKPKDPDTTKS
jgi:hypothetical protein